MTSLEEQMAKIAEEIISCKQCPLWQTRNKPLVGDGDVNSDIMMIGEAPGYHEDKQGKAFIGNAGKVLDQLLEHINLSREKIYITNILKCHPPKNHDPKPSEINGCIDYLFRQIKIVQPKIIVTLGKFASQELFSKVSLHFSKISDMHGEIFELKASYGYVKIVPLYHPSMGCYNISMIDIMKNDFGSVGMLLKQEDNVYENNNCI